MAKVLVLYYSSYGHIETMAQAIAEGARGAGASVDIKRVPELVSAEMAKASHFKTDQAAPVAEVAELAHYDAIVFGTPTRFGNMAAQMKNFLDQTGGLWAQRQAGRQGGLGVHLHRHPARRPGKHHPVDADGAAAPRHGHRRPALCVAGPDHAGRDLRRQPYGASTIAGGDGSRQPSANELDGARWQGAHVARIAAKLAA